MRSSCSRAACCLLPPRCARREGARALSAPSRHRYHRTRTARGKPDARQHVRAATSLAQGVPPDPIATIRP